ncbi:5-oxoprolinase subunit PxpB [Parvularcula lutaonensis]|uniref:5-oxoprolinase subunit PxpB n=1 Tax=Parvularcula lutaonensis TaxID=491923 RepID=A0ABV7M769_9PROT|nr:5-oxoprolinase subunit PxpB [Parvularcula lutaonensis]GGY56901.1 hypothetical protein GCM10007148_28020 [Parvularcula lutaonensis]
MADRRVTILSDRALTIGVASAAEARGIAERLRQEVMFEEVVPGLDSVSVLVNPLRKTLQEAGRVLEEFAGRSTPIDERAAPLVEIPVRYGGEDGPDLGRVARACDLSPDEVIALHSGAQYTVEILGFLPGFAYLGGLDPRLATERLAEPRLRVPAGSVGIGGSFSGIYSLDGSGGWPLVGRTGMALFDADAEQPFVLEPGRRVRFVPQ